MSTVVMSACWPLQMPPTQKAVLISLADNANDEGYCWPSIETICKRTCFGRTAVIEAVKWLEAHEFLTANRENGRKTTYTITAKNQSASRTGLPKSGADENEVNQSAKRTGPTSEPVRETNGTSPADGPVPVRQADTNRHITINEPSEKKPASAKRKPGTPVRFETFLKDCKANGEKPISDYKPVLDYAVQAGLPDEFLNLCWAEFKQRHSGSGSRAAKRQKDWRSTFRNCVEGNWYRLWYAKPGGEYELTTVGVQASRVHKEAA